MYFAFLYYFKHHLIHHILYIIYTTTISIILKLRWDCLILAKFSNISPEEYFLRNAASYLQWLVRKHFPRIFPITLTGTYRRYFWMLSQNSFRIFNVVPKFLPNFDVVPEFLQNFECWILNVEFWTLCQNCREFLQNSHVKIEICLRLLCCGINLVKCSSY